MSLEGKEENKLVMEITTPTTPMNYRNELFNGEEDVAGVVKYLLAPSPQEILPRFKGTRGKQLLQYVVAYVQEDLD